MIMLLGFKSGAELDRMSVNLSTENQTKLWFNLHLRMSSIHGLG